MNTARKTYHLGTHNGIAEGMREALALSVEANRLYRQVRRVLARDGEYREREIDALRTMVDSNLPHLAATHRE